MVQIAAGLAALKTQQPDRQPGQRRHRPQQADQRRDHVVQEAETADHEAERDADQRGQAEADADALEREEDVPADALVVRAVAVERVGKDLDGLGEGRRRRREGCALQGRKFPDADQQREAGHRRQQLHQQAAPVEAPPGRRGCFDRRRHRLGLGLDSSDRGRGRGRCLRVERGVEDGADHDVLLQALIAKLSAYFLGSLPSQTTPSISLLERIGSFGTLIFSAPAACL